jgi:2-methylfumaryl-CoA hydratase
MLGNKASLGNYFEDLTVGLKIHHAVPRTLTEGDAALYLALTASRYPLFCNAEFARELGFIREPIHDLLVFHIVFGKSVPDISLNAVANLGYADVRFGEAVYPGDTISAETEVIGRRESSGGDTGIIWVKTFGYNQNRREVIRFIRWVLVNKADSANETGPAIIPATPNEVAVDDFYIPKNLKLGAFDGRVTGGKWFWDDYEVGERIDHVEGMAIEEAEHQMAARLYQNTARAHFNAHALKDSRFGTRVVYGGHVISIARALSFNGLENIVRILAFNGGTHTNPTITGDTIFAYTNILEKINLNRDDCGALRLRLVATKNLDPYTENVELKIADEKGRERYHPNVVLDLDYTVLIPKRVRSEQ